MTVAVTGEPGATVQLLIGTSVRTSGVLGADGTATFAFEVTAREYLTAPMRLRYAEGDQVGPETKRWTPLVWDLHY
jgi:hypothetical protein